MNKFYQAVLIFAAIIYSTGSSFAQRSVGGTSVDLDDNAGNHIFLSNASGSLGINVTGAVPNLCALVDLTSTTKGLLVPRMTTLQEMALCSGTPPEGLIIYNTNTHSLDVYNGTIWGSSSGWSLLGNGNTNSAVNFLGTTNNQDLVIRTNGITRATFAGTPGTVLNISGSTATRNGLNVDLTTNPVTIFNTTAVNATITTVSGVNITGGKYTVSGNGNGNDSGVTASANSVSGNGSPTGISGTASGNGGGTITGVSSTATAGSGAAGNTIGVFSQANGGASSTLVVGVWGIANAINASTTVGGSFVASGATAGGFNTGIGVTANTGSGTNQGVVLNVGGTNSTGINFTGLGPTTGINIQASTTGVSINAPTSITANGLITTSGNLSVTGTSTLGNASTPIQQVLSTNYVFPAFIIPAGGTITILLVGFTGVSPNDPIYAGVDDGIMNSGSVTYSIWVNAANTARITFYNNSGAAINIAAGTHVRVAVTKF